VTVLCATVVVLITAPLSLFIQRSEFLLSVTSVKERSYHTSERLGVYRPPVANYSRLEELPIPLQVIEQYKQWHSVESLLRNDTVGRKYAVAFYQCPFQDGARMHHFFNDFLWAVLTNRTMLWKYYDRKTCNKYGKEYAPKDCQLSNTVNDCDEILLRAPWIPSYDEWASKLELEEPFEFPFRSTHPKSFVNEKFPWNDGDEKFNGADDGKKYPQQVAVFSQNVWKFGLLEQEEIQNEMLGTTQARERAKHLYAWGTDFLFGMLHRSAFDFSNSIRASEGTLDKENAVSVAVHSRHIYDEVDGCNMFRETKCLRPIIRSAHGSSVNVRLMSDRACTISRLTTWLGLRNISLVVAQHDKSKGSRVEHGPFAGAGYYQDLALAATARSVIVAMRRSSSDLLLELVVFHRKMDAWRGGEDVMTANVQVCYMDYQYNATPSTKQRASVKEKPKRTATSDSTNAKRLGVYRPPVPSYNSLKDLPLPLQVVEQYKRWHSVDNLLRNDTFGRKYAIAFYQCPLQAGNRMHHFFNDFLWAILTNRTMLWKYYDRESCLRYGRKLYGMAICRAANTADDCGEVLLRAPWIPSYDEWSPKLNLSEPYEFAFHSTHPKIFKNDRFPWKEGDEKLYGADDGEKYPYQVAVFAQNRFKFNLLEQEKIQNEMLYTIHGRECAKNLYALGTDFLFGMLHRSSFDFSNPIRASSEIMLDNRDAVSVAVHSRHIYEYVDGCIIDRETKCMQQILDIAGGDSVNVRLMSDRECTITHLTTWLNSRNISVAVAQHAEYKNATSEHGPFAGAGYYHDLALVSTARSAIVAMRRSSSDLLLELVVFNHKMDAWRAGEDVTASNVYFCYMNYQYNSTASPRQRSAGAVAVTSVKKALNHTATNDSLDANRLGVYRPPVPSYTNLEKLPLPLQVIEQYKQWHSVDNLLRNDTVGRKYSLAFYQCPSTAGNRMHQFFNDFLWAVLTNRTMLWKYWDRKTCLKYRKYNGWKICQVANTAKDCKEILLRAPWIPSYDEWAPKLNLPEPDVFPFRSTQPKAVVNHLVPWNDGDEKFYGVDSAEKYPQQVAVFFQFVWKFSLLEDESLQHEMLFTLQARERAKNLYALKTEFLFGMLHRSAFDFTNRIRASSEGMLESKNAVSVAVHSRHVNENVTGCNIGRETSCMQKILHITGGDSVNVRIMSDRECTISRLTTWLTNRNISVAVAQHDQHIDFLSEHGPFAGVGFFQDLALASTARSAIVAMRRSSSDLLLELVVFNRKMEAWMAGEDAAAANVEFCNLENM
jgi:hypothetical protein